MVNVQSIFNGVILPPQGTTSSPLGGVVDADGLYVENSCPNLGAGGAYQPKQLLESNEKVIYLGWINQVWGHTITDVLKKLWFVGTPACDALLAGGAKLVYISHLDKIPDYVYQFLLLAGIDLRKAEQIIESTRFIEVYVPDDCFVSYGDHPYFTDEYVALIERIKERVSGIWPVAERLYFTRTKTTKPFSWQTLWVPKELGEERLEKAFAACGYKIVAPEQLPVEQQLYLLMHCRYFAATEGSISHNSLFCAEGTKVAILKKEDRINPYTQLCNEVSKVDTTIIDVHKSSRAKSTFYGPFYLYVSSSLKQYLTSHFPGINITNQYYWLDPLWFWYLVHDTLFGRALQKLLRR